MVVGRDVAGGRLRQASPTWRSVGGRLASCPVTRSAGWAWATVAMPATCMAATMAARARTRVSLDMECSS
jgi:hypothetical protein